MTAHGWRQLPRHEGKIVDVNNLVAVHVGLGIESCLAASLAERGINPGDIETIHGSIAVDIGGRNSAEFKRADVAMRHAIQIAIDRPGKTALFRRRTIEECGAGRSRTAANRKTVSFNE